MAEPLPSNGGVGFDSEEYLAFHIQEIRAAHKWALKSLARLVQQVKLRKQEEKVVDPNVAIWLDETIETMKEAEEERDEIVRALEGSKSVQRINGRWWTRQALADGIVSSFLDLPQRDMRTLTISQVCHKFHAKFKAMPKDVHDRFEGPKLQRFLASLPALEQNDGPRQRDREIFTRRLVEGVPALKYNGLYERTHILTGDEGVKRLQEANVFIAGLGGVGSWVAEALARAGVGAMTVVDFDTVDVTNKNRQLLALDSTLGRNKAVLMAERIKDINPACHVKVVEEMITPDNIEQLITSHRYSAVVDCIDLIAHKVELLTAAYHLCIPTFTSCGAASKLDPMTLRVGDVLQTQGADVWSSFTRRLRDRLIERGVKEGGIIAVYSTDISSNPLTAEHVAGETFRPRSTNGTISFIPPLFGFALAGAIVNFLLCDDNLLFRLPRRTPLPVGGFAPEPRRRRHGAATTTDSAVQEAPDEQPSIQNATVDTLENASHSITAADKPSPPPAGPVPNDILQRFATLRSLIGNTPLLRVHCQYKSQKFCIYCKWEAQQLTGSTKDRVALQMLEEAYHDGSVVRQTEIVEASSGSTGVALASIGAMLGNPVTIVIPDSVSRERMALLYCYGAKILPIPVDKSKSRLQSCLDFAAAYTEQSSCRWQAHQFASAANVKAHRMGTGPEILTVLKQHDLEPTAFIAGVGTGGTVLGVGQCLRAQLGSKVHIHPLAITGCPIKDTPVRQRIQGLVEGFIPGTLREELLSDAQEKTLDGTIDVQDGDAILMAQRIASSLGLGVGMSSGANLLGAIKVWLQQQAAHPLPQSFDDTSSSALKDPVVVTIFCDCNKKYLTTDLIGKEPILPDYITPDVQLLSFDVL